MAVNNILTLLFLWFVVACSSNKTAQYDDFIQKHHTDNFNQFVGFGIFQRGEDENGNKLIYISKTLNTDSFFNSGYVLVAIDSHNEVVNVDSNSDNVGLNLDSIKNMAMYFCSLNIHSMGIDYDNKAYFSIYSFDEPDLMKITSDIDLGDIDKKKWKKIADHWYVKRSR